MVNGATVTATDVPTSNGIIHVIDKVLLPTATPNDIPRTAQCTGLHDSLVAAVVQAELLETLQGEGPFTVFAPTDQAFTDAGIDLAALDTEEGKAALTDILLYHVVGSEVPSSAVEECGTATAVNGDTLSFSVGDTVTVNGATVTLPDVATSNGVIHVIDKVLMPTDTPNVFHEPHSAQASMIRLSLQSFKPSYLKRFKARDLSLSSLQPTKPLQTQASTLQHSIQWKVKQPYRTSCSTTS